MVIRISLIKVLVLIRAMDCNVMTVEHSGQYSVLRIVAGVLILKMAQKFLKPGLIADQHVDCLIVLIWVKLLYHFFAMMTFSFSAYNSCVIVVRGGRYRIGHNRFGLDVSRCRRCLCQNGKLNDSTCVKGRSCVFITPGGQNPKDCSYNGVRYRHRDVFRVDKCNRCKCLNGKISGCTRRKCRNNDDDDDDTPCDRCRKKPRDPVCGPNGITYPNLCTAQFCAGLDQSEVTSGPCSYQVHKTASIYIHTITYSRTYVVEHLYP